MTRPRVLIEDWLPAQAIGVECMRERSTGQQPPDKTPARLVGTSPLTVSRAAVLASLLPADFDHPTFERLLGFYGASAHIVANERTIETARVDGNSRIPNPHGPRAFSNTIREPDLASAHEAVAGCGGNADRSGPDGRGGSIPLEAARLGLHALANEYNPVACSVLEATVDYPFRFGVALADTARRWGRVWARALQPTHAMLLRCTGHRSGLQLHLCSHGPLPRHRPPHPPRPRLGPAQA